MQGIQTYNASKLTSYFTEGVKSSLRNLWNELRIQHHHKSSLKRARRLRNQSHLKLNLGCGPKYKEGWINIDLQSNADLQLDIREYLPFKNNSVTIIYSEHFFEHLEYPREVKCLLGESLRILEPGGRFSVGVPDAEEILFQYANGELPALIQEWSKEDNLQWFPPWVWNTPMHLVNFFFRQGNEHKYAYDFETLKLVLIEAGFMHIERRQFNPELDSENRRDGTLYVDGYKPNDK